MRFLVLLAALAASTAFSASALAENQGDLDRCKLPASSPRPMKASWHATA